MRPPAGFNVSFSALIHALYSKHQALNPTGRKFMFGFMTCKVLTFFTWYQTCFIFLCEYKFIKLGGLFWQPLQSSVVFMFFFLFLTIQGLHPQHLADVSWSKHKLNHLNNTSVHGLRAFSCENTIFSTINSASVLLAAQCKQYSYVKMHFMGWAWSVFINSNLIFLMIFSAPSTAYPESLGIPTSDLVC